ncbi:MAG: FG-GAP-like repeat-containing protein [Acidobacteriaceae bacterium]
MADAVASSRNLNNPRKRNKLAILLLGLAAWHSAHSQQPLQLMQNHVPPAVSSGQAALMGSLPTAQSMSLAIVLPLRNQADLTSLLGRLYDPSSRDYRHFLTVDQFTEQFSPTEQDYQAVVSFAQANGFTVTDTPANRLIVPINGSVALINKALNLTMQVYRHPTEDRTFYAPDREPALNLGVRVAHIAGLNNFSIPRPAVTRAAEGQVVANVTGSGPGGSYLGSDMRAAYYGGTTLTGAGQTVGILEFGGYNLSDVNATFSTAGQSYSVPISNVLLDGATGAPEGDDGEQVLDIVQAIGMAPGLSQVRVYIGNGRDDANILNSMATENIAKQLSCSWSWVPDDPATDDVWFEEFAAQGQSFFVASGDYGAFDAAIDPFFYPGEDAYVTAVGATHLITNGAGGPWVSETAWNSEGAGSGGGISPDGIAIPSFQAGVANSSNGGSATLRNVPDVAMEGDFDNYNCDLQYGCGGGVAGTSFAAPRWAGFTALVNQQAVEAGTAPLGGVGSINPSIYSIGAGSSFGNDLHDVTVGTNDTEGQPVWFSAVTGYDLVTGWGSPNGQDLIDALAGPQVPGFWLASSSSNLSLAQGASNTTTITVTDAGGFTGSVSLAVTSALPTGVTASWGTNPTTGTSVLTLTANSSAPAATAAVTITGTSGSLNVTTNVTVTVHPPSFTLSDSPGFLTVNQGASGTSTITVVPQYGFTGNVSLAVTSPLPSGVTASWGTNPTSGSSVLTLTASSSAPFATANLTITGTSGSLTATTTLTLTVYAPGFTLSASSLNIGQGSSGTSYVYVYPQDGFTGIVNLAVSGLPSGVTASWSPNPTSGTSLLTLTASSTAQAASTTLTITGTSGNLSATATLILGVYPPGFTLSGPSVVSIGQGSTAAYSVYVFSQYGFTGSVNLAVAGLPSGVTALWSPNPTTANTTLTLTASSTATLGNATLTITGTSGNLTASTTLTLGVFVPSFTLSDYGNTSLGRGTSVATAVSVDPLYGFAGSVNLSVTGLPSGVTASFSPNPTTGSSTLTLTASSTATLGNATPIITGASGSLTASTPFTLGVYAPSFTLSDYSSLSIGQGSSGTSYIYVNPQYGFAGSVNLSVTGLPSGVTASFSPNPTTGSGTLTLTASSAAVPATTTLTITGASGSLTATTTLALTVNAPSFTLSDYSNLSIGQGASGTTTISVNPQYGFTGSVNLSVAGLPNGVTASFAPNPTNGSSQLTLTASPTAALGAATLTITGVSGSLTATTTLALTVNAPSFTLSDYSSVSIGQGTSGTTTVYVNPQYGFTGSVNLSVAGLPSGVTASWSPNPTTGSSTLTLTASSTAALGNSTLTITGASGALTASATLTLGVYAPTFTLSDSYGVSVGQGSTSTAYAYVSPQYGFTGSVNLSVTGLPGGVTASFAPNPTTGTSTLTLTASDTATPGASTLTITGTSGSMTETTTLALSVYAPSFTLSTFSGVSVGQGTSATSNIYVYPQYGFTGSVSFSITGLPSGVTASFSPNPATSSSVLTLTASSSASLGQYNVTITGSSGSTTASTILTVGVYVPSFTVSDSSSVSIGQGTSGTTTVSVNPQAGFTGSVSLSVVGLPSGVTASWSPNPTTGSSVLTLRASSTASLGQYNVTIIGASSNLTASTTLVLGVYLPSFTLNDYSGVAIGQGGSGTSYVYINPLYGFTGSVNLSVSGLPSGVTASFAPNPASTGSSMLTLTASSTASLGQYNVTITGSSGSATASATVTLAVYAPSFTISDSYSVSVGRGNSATSYIYVNPQTGFTGSVSLAASGLPSGVTASFTPNPTTGTSTLTLSASSAASLGQYTVTITGSSGNVTASTTLTLGVYAPSFTLSDYSNLTIGQGTSATSTVNVIPQYGFAGSVSLSITGLPSGVTASFAPNPTSTGSSVLTLTASSTASLGQYNVTVIGASGSLTSTTTLTVGVYVPSFTLSDYSSVSVGQGSYGTSYVYVNSQYGFAGNVALSVSGLPSGVTASFAPNPTSSGSSVLTLSASSTATLGTTTLTITGTSGNLTASTTIVLGVYIPSFTLSDYSSVSIGQGSYGTSYVYVNSQYGFAGNVTLSVSGLPSGVTASFTPNPTSSGSSVLTLTASSTAAIGTTTLIITGASGSVTATTPLTLSVYAPSFTLSDSYSLSINQGASGMSTVYVDPQYGFTGSVSLTASGLPSGVTASFLPNPTTGISTLTLTASNTATPGLATVTITGTSGALTATTPLSLTVNPQSFTLQGAPSELDLVQGASGNSTISVLPVYGFAGYVSLSASGLPSGVTASFSPNPTSTGSSLLILTASGAAPGMATVTVTGTSGVLTATTAVALTVRTAPAITSTTLAVTSAGAPVTSVATGTVVTLTAAVTAGSTLLTTGQVRFCDATAAYCEDIHLLGTAQLTSKGTAVLKLVPGMGSHSYKAVFAGTQTNGASSSSTTALTVTAVDASTTAIAQSGAAGDYTLTATVTGQGLLSPTGNVSFLDTSNADLALATASLGRSGTALSSVNSQSPGTGSDPYSIATGDFNRDGIPDLAIANDNSNTLTILMGKGDGTFTTSAVSPATGSGPISIAVGDFNGDGIPDLAVASFYSNTVTILLGNGDGTFTQSANPPTGSYPISIAVGDFNADGIPDLAVVNEDSNTVTILLGNGDGTFASAASPATGSNPKSVAVGDFNGDGIPDLAVANELGYTVTILLGNGDGTFAPAASPATGSDPTSVAVGDFNGDGKADLAVANVYSSMTILLGNGDGTFTEAASPSAGNEPLSVVVGDFNGDGKVDLAVSNFYSNNVTVLLGNGDGTFTPGASPATGSYPAGIVAADLNGDGIPDLAVANSGSNTATVLTTKLTQTATATASGISPVGNGSHLVEASYPGDSDYSSSVSATTGLTPLLATPTVLVTPSSSSITAAQSLTVTVAVSGGTGNPIPTGSVTLSSGSYTSAPMSLSAGNFTFGIPAGSLASGSDTLTVSYTPDSASSSTYNNATGSNSVIVTAASKTTPAIAWATPVAITYGTALGTAQLNASSTVAGTFAYSPALGAVLAAGQQTLTATLTPTDTTDYTDATASVVLTVNLAAPTISFSVPNHTYGDAPFAVSATSNSSAAIAYSVVSGPATVSGSTVTLTAAGAVVLQAGQAASGNYAAGTQNAAFTVSAASQTIAFPAPASPINYGAAPVPLSATATSGLPVTFSVLSGPATISGSTLTGTGAGTVVVAADQPGNANYTAAVEVTHTIAVNKIAPTVGLTTSPNPVLVQNAVTFTATVASASGTPTGSVVFSSSGSALGTSNLAGGIATLTVSTLAVGSNSISAAYSGDGNFTSVTSTAVSETVQDFTLTASSSSQTVQPGATATYSIPISLSGGSVLPAPVAFSVSGLPAGFTATFNPPSLAAGSAATNVTLTIQVPQTAMLEWNLQSGNSLPLAALAVLLLPLASRTKRTGAWPRRLRIAVMILAGTCGVAALIGCGGGGGSSGGGSSSPPQTYNIAVNATSGALSHSTTITLTVQ